MISNNTSSIVAPPSTSNTSFRSTRSTKGGNQSESLKDVAERLQTVVDNFRRRGGLSAEYNNNPKQHRFSYEAAARKLSEWPQELESTIKALSSKVQEEEEGGPSELSLGFHELCRQARRSVEVDMQRVISRWVREFIERNKAGNDVVAAFESFRAVVESFPRDSVLVHGAAPLLDATMQWLLPRCVRKCQRARSVVQQLQANQRQLVAATQSGHSQLSQQRRVADDCERILAQCRVALSDFTTQTQQSLRGATQKLSSNTGGGDDDDGDENRNESAQRLIDNAALSLVRFSTGMREHLAEVTDKMTAGSNSDHGSTSVPSALLLGTSPADKNGGLLLDDSDDDNNNNFGGTQFVVEIEATDEEKRRELAERQHFADRSSTIMMANSGVANSGVAVQHEEKSIATSPLGSPLGGGGGGGGGGSKSSVAMQRLQLQLSEAQELLNHSEQSQTDREAVIEQLQGNLSAMSSALERVAGERAGDLIAEQFGGTTRRGGFQNEVDMLRSQLAVQQERIAHLSSSLEERGLREQALQREADTLRASESVLKSELQYQQTAANAANDELIASQTALFETREMLAKCEKSRKEYADAYNRLVAISTADRQYAATMTQQAQQMSIQLDNSVLLAQVEEMLSL